MARSVVNQAKDAFAIVEDRLARRGYDTSKIAPITCWLARPLDVHALTEIWNDWVDPDYPPVRLGQVNRADALSASR